MLDEVTMAIVSERDGVFVMDLTFRLNALVDYQLNKQAFSGFNFQGRKDGTSFFTNSAGKVNLPDPHYSVPELNWPPAPWYGYVITTNAGETSRRQVRDSPSYRLVELPRVGGLHHRYDRCGAAWSLSDLLNARRRHDRSG